MHKFNYCNALGFTLIEVLVSMVILALGLLGLASLQGIALKNNQDAFLFGQANALAYEMSDRIKANTPGWIGVIPTAAATCTTTCDSLARACSVTQMAAYDYCYWQRMAIANLSPSATAVVTISPKAGSTVCTGTASSRCLTMTWSRTNQQLSAAMNTTIYEMEVTP